MQRKTLIAAAVAAAVVGGVAVSLAPARGNAPAKENAKAAAPAVSTDTVALREVTEYYVADAVIEAVRAATVSAQIAGQVTQFYVDAGDRVKRGQLLARIDTREADAQLEAGRAGVTMAEAQLAQAKINFERTQKLLRENFVSQAALDKAEADLKAAQAALDAARADATRAATARSFAEVRAPIDGVVTRRLLELGELAAPGRGVVELHDPKALRAVGAVPQFVLPQVAARGAKTATVRLPTLEKTLEARLTLLPAADPRLLSTQVRAELPADPGPGVVPGTVAKIQIPLGTAKKLTMPAAAVVRRGELTATYVVGADGVPQLRQIRVGETVADGYVEVLAGLAAGERVQLNPLLASR
ncbi:MAG: efflux RND transporter periplasmic adaptor subunit [Burkholderiaceae bacterium]|nr:efflux RND transporter periplasmic adaptor subunit [Burkholderiaceae bacterium]